MSATLYAVHSSHSAHAARLMLEHKGIEHRVVNLVPGTHAALKLDGRRVQGSRTIARALEEAARFALELMPDYPTGVPAGFVPQEWLDALRR